MANKNEKDVFLEALGTELVFQQIQFLEAHTDKNNPQLKYLKGWLINQKLDELGGKTMLEVAQ